MTPRALAEAEGKPIALTWLASAQRALERPADPLTRAALATNFRWNDLAAVDRPRFLGRIARACALVRAVLALSRARFFADASETEARALFRGVEYPPAYALFRKGIYFTPRFAPFDPESGHGFGPKCRAAMVIHEAVHVFDRRSGEPQIHISEWDEPRFSALTPAQAIHNPSAYASFAAQVYYRELEWPRDARFGAGQPGA